LFEMAGVRAPELSGVWKVSLRLQHGCGKRSLFLWHARGTPSPAAYRLQMQGELDPACASTAAGTSRLPSPRPAHSWAEPIIFKASSIRRSWSGEGLFAPI